MDPDLEAELRAFYKPYTLQLGKLLKEKGYKSLPSWVDSV
jgi:hypothetical protein